MNNKVLAKYLTNLYASAHDSMMKNYSSEKLNNQYYGEREMVGRIIVDAGVMTRNELQKFLVSLNEKY